MEVTRTKKKTLKKHRLFDLDVLTVGLVDNPAVEGSRIILAKRAEVDDDLSAPLSRDQEDDDMHTTETVLLTPQEIAYYRYREKAEAACEATLDWLANLSEERFVEELGQYDSDTQRYWLTEVENYLAAEQG